MTTGEYAGGDARGFVIPPQLDRAKAERLVLARAPAASCMSVRAVHHPYAGFIFAVEQLALGTTLRTQVPTMVNLRNSSAATCDRWPAVEPAGPDVVGPLPLFDDQAAEQQARQCVVRALLHRRFPLAQPTIEVVARYVPLHKPNWLVRLRLDGAATDVLVDGITGAYHVVTSRRTATTVG